MMTRRLTMTHDDANRPTFTRPTPGFRTRKHRVGRAKTKTPACDRSTVSGPPETEGSPAADTRRIRGFRVLRFTTSEDSSKSTKDDRSNTREKVKKVLSYEKSKGGSLKKIKERKSKGGGYVMGRDS